MDFNKTFSLAMGEEGGGKFHINSIDGMATKWGISSGSGYSKKPIKDITEKDAKEYYLNLWTKNNLTLINDNGLAYLITRRSMYSPAKYASQLEEVIQKGLNIVAPPELVKDPKGYYKRLSPKQIAVLNALKGDDLKRFKQFYISFTKSKLNKKIASNIAKKWVNSLAKGFNDVGAYIA